MATRNSANDITREVGLLFVTGNALWPTALVAEQRLLRVIETIL